MKRTTIWTCDSCQKEATVTSGPNNLGTGLPSKWEEVVFYLEKKRISGPWARYLVICDQCINTYYPIETTAPETKKHLSAPFWKKIIQNVECLK